MLSLFQIVSGSFLKMLAIAMYSHRVQGLEKIKGLEDSGVIFVSNHCSLIDGPVGGMALPVSFLPIRFLATEDYFSLKDNRMPKGFKWVSPLYTRMNGCIKVYSKQNPHDALAKVLLALEKKAKIWVFPEGTRTKDGNLQKGKPGAAYLHKHSGAPIVPVGLMGTFKPKPFRNKMVVKFGDPIYLQSRSLKKITNTIMRRIELLT